ncbi:MAG: glycoside hydrolase family 26 protein [Tannerellaceae bacterium]|nr:glycoside hydrolase family 26 protein [Tannerellaceae bacterium]
MKFPAFTLCFFLTALGVRAGDYVTSNPQATPEAKALFSRLVQLQSKGVMYGHQDDLMCGSTWWYEAGRSDTKDVTGDYPAVAGFELGEIETGRLRSLDSVAFNEISERVKWFHARKGIITISWHAINPITAQWPGIKRPNNEGSAWDVAYNSAAELNAVRSILPGGANHQMFNYWLDRLARYFHSWRDDEGRLIPFIFRPYHEHSGSFFWWGDTRCTDEEYAELWRYTVKYFRAKDLNNILFCYNTDKVSSAEQFLRGYPGDEYIDMVSIDWYGYGEEFNTNIEAAMKFTTRYATEHGKLHALSECGPISLPLLDILKKYPNSYVLTWRNAPPRGGMPAFVMPDDPAELENIPGIDPKFVEMMKKMPRPKEMLKAMHADPKFFFLEDIKKF